VVTSISRLGNFSLTCPVVEGFYYMKDFYFNENSASLSMFQTKQLKTIYLLRVAMFDEITKKPVKIFKYDFYIKSIKGKKN
jgi:hypothetical protein